MQQSCALRFVRRGMSHVLSDVLQYASQTVVAGVLNSCYLGLFKAWPGFALGLEISDLTPASFGGYARKLVTWGDTGIDKSGRPQAMGGVSQWQPTDSSVSESIIGVFAADALIAGGLIAVGLLPQQIIMGTPADVLGILPRFAVPGLDAPDWGELVGVA